MLSSHVAVRAARRLVTIATLFTMFACGRPASAQPVPDLNATTASGGVERFTLAPNGEVDGLVLDEAMVRKYRAS